MHQNARKILIFALFALSLLPVGLLVPYYQGIYSALKQYHVHGLVFCWLGSYVLANFCTPGFMQGVENKKEYESRGPLEIVTLYLSVMVITFVVLGVIIFVLWCVGWLIYFLEVFFDWLKDRTLEQLLTRSCLSKLAIHREMNLWKPYTAYPLSAAIASGVVRSRWK